MSTMQWQGLTVRYKWTPAKEATGLHGRREDMCPPVPPEVDIDRLESPSGDNLEELLEFRPVFDAVTDHIIEHHNNIK